MPKKRIPERDKAQELYLNSTGTIKLIEIANHFNLPEGTIRGWKNKDSWDDKLNGTFQKPKPKTKGTERSKKKLTPKQEVKEIKSMKLDEAELTEKQRLFCLYYIKSFNATMSAIKAGYAAESAHVTGSDLLRHPKVGAEIRRLKGKMQEELFVDAMDVLNKYIKIAFADMNDFVEFGTKDVFFADEYGNVVKHKDSYLNYKDSSEVDGTLICEIKKGKQGMSIKLEDRQKALDKLAMYFDLFPDKFKRRIQEEELELKKKDSEVKGW